MYIYIDIKIVLYISCLGRHKYWQRKLCQYFLRLPGDIPEQTAFKNNLSILLTFLWVKGVFLEVWDKFT